MAKPLHQLFNAQFLPLYGHDIQDETLNGVIVVPRMGRRAR
jgi:hypothetical protein